MSTFIDAISSLTNKRGIPIKPIIKDMKARDNAVLIAELSCDDEYSPIASYIADNHAELAGLGIASLAELSCCDEIMIYSSGINVKELVKAIKVRCGVPITAIIGPTSPVLREETALYAAIDTGIIRVARAELDYKRQYPSYGFRGRPTLVIDGETAYQAGRLSENPAVALTKLVSVNGSNSKIKEVNLGTALSQLFDGAELNGAELSGKALIGGVCGQIIDVVTFGEATIKFQYEFDSIKLFSKSECIISALAVHYQSIKDLSCQKCIMCREGSLQLSTIFSDIAAGRANRDDPALIEDICPLIQAGTLCDFGKGMILPALSAISECRDDFEKHIIARTCPAGSCGGFMKYIIDPSICTGCGDCIDSCPDEAIEGKDGFIHIIDEKLCEKCGKCVDACQGSAIKIDSGTVRIPKKPVKVGRFK